MGIQMPLMGGNEATALLREQEYTGTIVALTAHAMASDREKALEAGCDAYETKPVELPSLLAAIEKLLGNG